MIKYRFKGKVNSSFILRGMFFSAGSDIDLGLSDRELDFVNTRCDAVEIIDLHKKTTAEIPETVLEDKPKVVKETKVCTKIQRQSVITISGDNGSGKSTVAANLAYIIAKNTALKVLLIDFDTISGSLEEYFRVNKIPKKPEYILSADKASSLNYMVDAIDKRIFDNNFFERYVVEIPNCKNLSLI